MLLSGEPFRTPGAPGSARAVALNASAGRDTPTLNREADPATVELALDILGTFNFKGTSLSLQVIRRLTECCIDYSLSEFVRDCVVNYLEDDNADIRRAAALTCCQILANDPVVSQTSNHAIKLVNEVLEKLLTLAIADPGSSLILCSRRLIDADAPVMYRSTHPRSDNLPP